ncbi:MAG: hypothetical protein ACERKD_15290 [Prolixibacteraceae bacterium]
MKTIDLSKPVKLKQPGTGEENLIFKVTNYNEVTKRCYNSPTNLPNWTDKLLPNELVSVDDLINVE